MKKLENIISNTVFAIQVLLAFLLLFEQYIQLPLWLAPVGRMHPLVLHFPIGLLVLVGLIQFAKKEFEKNAFEKINSFILNISAISASLTALMGFFLAQEGGYSGEMLTWHKWTGVIVSFLTYGLLILNNREQNSPLIFRMALGLSLVFLVVAGHYGANLTHGENYVFAPIMENKTMPVSAESPFFEAAVMPILEDKCTSCHNERKHKGDLIMTNVTDLLKGGENGPVWVEGDTENSALMQRIHLPLENEEHMPPEGKPQLTKKEIELLSTWIDAGADLKKPLKEFQPEEPLYQFAANKLNTSNEGKRPTYTFDAASVSSIEKLNNPFRTVVPEAFNSPALNAQIFVRQNYQPKSLSDLLEVKKQLVSLNLTDMPITDADMKTISQFEQLRTLILNGTDIEGKTLGELRRCVELRSLALSGTNVDASISSALNDMQSLEDVYVWNTMISAKELENLQQQFSHITFHIGYIPDEDELLKLSPPMLENESKVLTEGEKVRFKHLFPNVRIHYTTDGSEPDSIESPIYTEPFNIKSFTQIKAKAFTEGWLGSDLVSHTFFKKGFQADSVELLTQPNKRYQGSGAKGLIDGTKGEPGNFRTPDWLGYQENAFSALLDFGNESPTINYITLSYAVNMGSYIMPPVWVEVWAGNERNNIQRLKRARPKAPVDYEPNRVDGFNIEIPPSNYRYYKVVAEPIRRLPSWHQGKGDKGWVFVDEVFVY